MPITITLGSEVNNEAAARVRQVADDYALRDPQFNGARIRIERGDFTSIDGDSVPQADIGRLFGSVQRAIDGR